MVNDPGGEVSSYLRLLGIGAIPRRSVIASGSARACGLNAQDLTAVTFQVVQAMASLLPMSSALTAIPFNQTTNDLTQPSNHLAQPH